MSLNLTSVNQHLPTNLPAGSAAQQWHACSLARGFPARASQRKLHLNETRSAGDFWREITRPPGASPEKPSAYISKRSLGQPGDMLGSLRKHLCEPERI